MMNCSFLLTDNDPSSHLITRRLRESNLLSLCHWESSLVQYSLVVRLSHWVFCLLTSAFLFIFSTGPYKRCFVSWVPHCPHWTYTVCIVPVDHSLSWFASPTCHSIRERWSATVQGLKTRLWTLDSRVPIELRCPYSCHESWVCQSQT